MDKVTIDTDTRRTARARAEQSKRQSIRLDKRLDKIQAVLLFAEHAVAEATHELPEIEKEIEEVKQTLDATTTEVLPKLRDEAEKQQLQVLALTQDHRDAAAEARRLGRQRDKAVQELQNAQKWHEDIMQKFAYVSEDLPIPESDADAADENLEHDDEYESGAKLSADMMNLDSDHDSDGENTKDAEKDMGISDLGGGPEADLKGEMDICAEKDKNEAGRKRTRGPGPDADEDAGSEAEADEGSDTDADTGTSRGNSKNGIQDKNRKSKDKDSDEDEDDFEDEAPSKSRDVRRRKGRQNRKNASASHRRQRSRSRRRRSTKRGHRGADSAQDGCKQDRRAKDSSSSSTLQTTTVTARQDLARIGAKAFSDDLATATADLRLQHESLIAIEAKVRTCQC